MRGRGKERIKYESFNIEYELYLSVAKRVFSFLSAPLWNMTVPD